MRFNTLYFLKPLSAAGSGRGTAGISLAICAAAAPFALALLGRGIWGPVLMLAGLIFVHELGHFLAAKFMGMPVDVFSLGFGPRLIGFKWRETDVRLSLLPLGGYVKLAGYNPEEPGADDPYGFLKQPAWKRTLFYSGGIIANVIACAALVYFVSVDRERYPAPIIKLQVQEGSAAEAGGLKNGDELRRVGTLELPQADWNDDIVPYIRERANSPIEVQIMRDGELMDFTLTPRLQGQIGILGITAMPSVSDTPLRPMHFKDFITAVPQSIKETAVMGALVAKGFWRLISLQASVKEIGGPIAIVKLGSEAAKAGWAVYFYMTAFISMNLAVLNALPIPFLDGGHICILAFERLRRKDLSIEIKEKILTVGFFFMAALMVLVVFMDVWRIWQ
ncbi:MAG: RIP metalloprotease RseP [Holophagales bacterium]|jgi:regulator of sigma E protease|nr:RIP metalloprotease RseP [Holophagales bacterium]